MTGKFRPLSFFAAGDFCFFPSFRSSAIRSLPSHILTRKQFSILYFLYCLTCEGIAKAFKLLCNEFSIKCIVVLGKADPKGIFDGDSYHAWNLVKIGNESYYVDPTWANMYDKGLEHISYDYFNLTTDEILKDHRPIGDLPLCTATRLNYFTCTNSFVDSYDSLIKLIEKRKNSKAIMFKFQSTNGEFLCSEESYAKSYMALQQSMFLTRKYRKFTLLLNEPHNIGKILFLE